jgi:predicted transcriptional regulator
VNYCFIWQERESNNIFVKVGQYPELEERVPDILKQALDGDDLKLYNNALRMRNFNLGVAAVADMRRVIENRMNDLLEILHEAAIAHNAPAELIERDKEMKGGEAIWREG